MLVSEGVTTLCLVMDPQVLVNCYLRSHWTVSIISHYLPTALNRRHISMYNMKIMSTTGMVDCNFILEFQVPEMWLLVSSPGILIQMFIYRSGSCIALL